MGLAGPDARTMGGTGPTSSFTDPKVTNPPFSYPSYMPKDSRIQRGYMRLLGQVLQANLGNVPDTPTGKEAQRALNDLGAKLDFQFNPNQLNRSVTARTDTQLWINQSPSELLTPGLGDMSFTWQMLFNREEEVQRYYNTMGRWSRSASAAEWLNSHQLDNLLRDPSDPMVAERIGVLADIMVMDQITGQRLTEAAVAFSEKWSDTQQSDDSDEPGVDEALSASRKSDLIRANMTNSAFLIPNPIRVVFSENFMVDGYVNTVSVSIQKFSPDMVPTVATVDISMHALYQGFARKATVFTVLADQITDSEQQSGENPYDSEDQNRVATNKADASYEWQALGMTGTPILAGFDHSPMDAGRDWSGDAATQLKDYRNVGGHKTEHQPLLGDKDEKAHKGGGSLRMQLGDVGGTAISYGIASNLNDSDLGRFLRNNGGPSEAKEYFNSIKDRLSVTVDVGVALRARLKATSQASLNQLWMDGDENGFSTYHKGAQNYTSGEWEESTIPDRHFFDRWSREKRRDLFAIGIDTYVNKGSSNEGRTGQLLKETTTQSDGYYTRSFPILEMDDHPGYYGDHFYLDRQNYGPSDINIEVGNNAEEGWIWLADKNGYSIPSDKWQLSVARGFYNSDNTGFPNQLTLVNASTDNEDHTYDILYQQILTMRVRLMMTDPDSNRAQNFVISDTGVMWVYPRDEDTGIVNDVDGEGWSDRGVHGHLDLQGGMQGVPGPDIDQVMENYEWVTDLDGTAVDKELYYDGLYGSGQEHQNMKKYGWYSLEDFSDASLGGMMISSVDIKANNTAVFQ